MRKWETTEDIIDFYLEQDFWILPITRGQKDPPFSWQDKPKPDKGKLLEYLSKGYDLAVACGSRSGNLVCIDVDEPKLYHKIFGKGTEKETLVVMTSYKGSDRKRHVYFRTDWAIASKHFKHAGVAIDIQGEGNYAKIPPSFHSEQKGKEIFYEFEKVPPEEVKGWKGDFVYEFLNLLKARINFEVPIEKIDVGEIFKPRGEGERHYWQIRIVAWLQKCETDKETAWEKVVKWNRANNPPLPDEELEYQFKSMWESAEEYAFGFDEKPGEFFSQKVMKEAESILKGDPIKAVVDAVHEIHIGDDLLIIKEYISAIGAKVEREKLNTWAIGKSQIGKSHLKYSVLFASLPRNFYEVFTSCSPLSLFYYIKEYGEWALSDMLIYIDEVEASEQTLPIMRSLTGQVAIVPRHLSVHEAEILDLKIEGKRTVWFTSVSPIGTDQLRNRFIFLNPDESVKQAIDVYKLQVKRCWRGILPDAEKFDRVKAMSQIIMEMTKDSDVKFPFDIDWPFYEWRYLFPKFTATCKIIAKIMHARRERDDDGNIIGTEEDVEFAVKVWNAIGKELLYRVNKSAQEILDILPETREHAMTKAEISQATGKSTGFVHKYVQELSETELINQDKQREGRQWIYWKNRLPDFTDIKIIKKEEVVDFSRRTETEKKSEKVSKGIPGGEKPTGKENWLGGGEK